MSCRSLRAIAFEEMMEPGFSVLWPGTWLPEKERRPGDRGL